MFEIGMRVCYRSEGVCRIVDIREESFGGSNGTKRYYVLSPLYDEKSTVYVPMENEQLVSKMRPLLSAQELCELMASLRDRRMTWIPESRARNACFREILTNGAREELVILLLTLLERETGEGKRVSSVDDNAARRAKRLLLDEWSATTDLETEEDLIGFLRGERSCQDRA